MIYLFNMYLQILVILFLKAAERQAVTRYVNSRQPNSFHMRKYSKHKTRHHHSGWTRWYWWCSFWYFVAWAMRCCAICGAPKRRDKADATNQWYVISNKCNSIYLKSKIPKHLNRYYYLCKVEQNSIVRQFLWFKFQATLYMYTLYKLYFINNYISTI